MTDTAHSHGAQTDVQAQVLTHSHGVELDLATSVGDAMLTSPVIAAFFSGMLASERSPWLVIVIRFRDDLPMFDRLPNGKPVDLLEKHRQLFTGAGRGTMNMVDYFHDNSHGRIDVSDSSVVGVYTINYLRADYIGNVPPQAGKINRGGVLDAGRAAAVSHGVDLSAYSGVVVCGYTPLDLCGWVGGMAALCDVNSLSPDLLGQEMGHGYGSNHSGLDGSTLEYGDPWDTMSTWSPYSAPNADYSRIGPGLNAWNMRLRGWLNEGRVVTVPTDTSVEREIVLGPLHDRGIQAAAIDVDGYLVELRLKDRWDAGIPRACVLVHRAQSNRTYLMNGTGGRPDLAAGDSFEQDSLLGVSVKVTVLAIEERSRRARIKVRLSVPHFHVPDLVDRHWPQLPGDPGPVERPDARVQRLHEQVERYAKALELADHYGTPTLALRALGEVAAEVGRQTAATEVTTFHEGYSFHDGFAGGHTDTAEPRTEAGPHPHDD